MSDEKIEDDVETLLPVGIDRSPSYVADLLEAVERKVPGDIHEKYEVYSYRNAAVILAETRQSEFAEICDALQDFTITTAMIMKAGDNESDMPKVFGRSLRPNGWNETIIKADLEVTLAWRETVCMSTKGKAITEARSRTIKRER